jgi:hypothetical protein
MKREVRMRVTLDRIGRFEEAISAARVKSPEADVDPVIWKAQIDGMESMLESLRREYADMEACTPEA